MTASNSAIYYFSQETVKKPVYWWESGVFSYVTVQEVRYTHQPHAQPHVVKEYFLISFFI